MARCKSCTWKAGLIDEHTLCVACKGSGKQPEVKKAKKGKKGKK